MVAVPETIRTLLFMRAGFRCEVCGSPGHILDPHHRQPRGMGGVHGAAEVRANDIRNFLAVCRPCHDQIDADPDPARLNGWLVPHGTDPFETPALIHTVNGFGLWLLTSDAGYQWVDQGEPEL